MDNLCKLFMYVIEKKAYCIEIYEKGLFNIDLILDITDNPPIEWMWNKLRKEAGWSDVQLLEELIALKNWKFRWDGKDYRYVDTDIGEIMEEVEKWVEKCNKQRLNEITEEMMAEQMIG